MESDVTRLARALEEGDPDDLALLADVRAGGDEPLAETNTYRMLAELPMRSLDETATYALLVRLLEAACAAPRTRPLVRIVLAFWGDTNESEEQISTLARLFLTNLAPTSLLKELVDELADEVAFDALALEIMRFDDRAEIRGALARLSEVFGRRSYLEAELLYRQAVAANQTRGAAFFLEELQTQAPFAPVPPWVKPHDPPREHAALVAALPPSPEADACSALGCALDVRAEQLVASLAAAGIEAEDEDRALAVEAVRRSLAVASDADRLFFAARELEAVTPAAARRFAAGQRDHTWFRVLGPVNVITGDRLDGDDVCERFGGCRMFTCNCFERGPDRAGFSYDIAIVPDDGESVDSADWFYIPRCQNANCKRPRIRARTHAVRLPLAHGGWRGCFCSVACLRAAAAEDAVNNGSDGTAVEIAHAIIDRVRDQLLAIGVVDCAPAPRPDDEENNAETALLAAAGHAAAAPAPLTAAESAAPAATTPNEAPLPLNTTVDDILATLNDTVDLEAPGIRFDDSIAWLA